MEEYKSNSHKSRAEAKAEERKIEKVVTSTVKTKKKSGFQKFTNVFIPEDVENVKSYIIDDIVVPTVKDLLLDVFRAFLGIDKRSSGKASKISYGKYYNDGERMRERSNSVRRSGYEYDDIIIPNRGEAEEVLSRMDELVDTYGLVSVADFYDLVGITGNYTDNKYGWTNIRNANVIRVADGYMIKLPRALPLN